MSNGTKTKYPITRRVAYTGLRPKSGGYVNLIVALTRREQGDDSGEADKRPLLEIFFEVGSKDSYPVRVSTDTVLEWSELPPVHRFPLRWRNIRKYIDQGIMPDDAYLQSAVEFLVTSGTWRFSANHNGDSDEVEFTVIRLTPQVAVTGKELLSKLPESAVEMVDEEE